MSNTPENGGDGGESITTGLFPLFPTQTTSVSAISTAPQWLRNASFTTDLSVIDAAASTAPSLSDVEASEEDEEGDDAGRSKTETNQRRSYDLIEEEEGSESDDDDKGKRKRDKKKKKRKIRDSDEYLPKPAKDYYLDTRPDPDNLAYGSIYRMNVPRYKLDYSQRGSESGSMKLYLRNRRGSILDGEIDVSSLDGKAKSDNRYWYAKNAAMERNKNFRRIRLSASCREAVDSSFDSFIPLEEEGEAVQESEEEEEQVVGMSWEDEVLNKTREFNRQTRERPHDEKAWLAFAEFQDKVSSMQSQKGVRLQTLEKKISILEKAFELNPDSEELLLALLKAYRSRDSADVLISRWEKALMQNSSSYKLWREFLRVVQGEFSRFKVSEVRKMYSYAIQALFSACSKRHRQMDVTSEPLDSALIQQELVLVDMLVSLCRFEWQAGYRELATALFQAEMEYGIFSPSLLLSEQSKLRLFEHFWSSNGARVGEEEAFGWSLWLEKEEEQRQKMLKEESSDDNDVGGWTGWTEQLSDRKEDTSVASANTEEGDVNREGVDEEMEDEDGMPEDDTEAMLKLLGIDVDAAASDEVKDTSTWVKWFEEEVSRDQNQWMPTRKAGEFSSVDEMGEREDEEQLSSLVLYEDINGYLFSLRSKEARLSLVYQFIDFFGARIIPWTSTNSLWWSEKISSLETLSDSILENLRNVHESLSKSDISLGSLLGGSNDISMRTEMMKFLRNAILLCLNVFPRNYILEEAVLVAEELFVTNMKTCEVATTPCQALAKRLLKSDRQDLLLCGVYAQREAASGNMKHARRIFDMALTSICGLPKELQDNAPLLYLWYAESEITNSSGSGPETESSSRALHILCYLGSGLAYVPYTSHPPSSMQILRARQGFREKLKLIQSIWSHGVTDDQSEALVCSAALFEELTNDLPGAVEILEHMFSSVRPGRRSQSHQLENLFNHYVRMLQRHQDDLTLSKLWKPISEGMQLYPLSPELYRALIDICNHRMTSHRLRMVFDDYSRTNPSVVVWLFALSYELSRGGSLHRIRGLFERALAQDTLNSSVILWRCYIAYEIDVAHNPSAARRIYFRAINACPWSKKLWLDGFGKLSSVLTAKEMSDLQEVMRDKELNIRTDIYEILLLQG
ncbi:hypothetical protein HA466_0026970 [Hirschfeldia incana]|nr:hypothetical protein HA466_0026970 [Hirschfeldia incana]